MMDHYYTSDLTNVTINWINDGSDPNLSYPSGALIDVSRGEPNRCIWTWKTADAVQGGLVFIKCRRCESNVHAIEGNAGTLIMPCNPEVWVGAYDPMTPSPSPQQIKGPR